MSAARSDRWRGRLFSRAGGSFLVAVALAAVLLFFALRDVNWAESWQILRQGRPERLGLAAVMLTISYSIRAIRWRILLAVDRKVSPIAAFWGICAGYLGNSFLPARAGEVIRSVLVSRRTGLAVPFVLATAVTERVTDAIALVIALFASLALLGGVPGLPDWIPSAGRYTLALAVVALGLLLLLPRLERRLLAVLRRVPITTPWVRRLEALLSQFLLGMRGLANGQRALAFVALTAVIWPLDTLVAMQVAQAFGLELGFGVGILLLSSLGLASAAPSTPGFIGIYQAVTVVVLAPFAFSRDQAVVFILAFQGVTYFVVTLWGLIGLWRLSRSTTQVAIPPAINVPAEIASPSQ